MDQVRELVRQRLEALGLSMAEASRKAGRNHAYLQQFLERGIPAKLPEQAREDFAPVLGVQPGQLRDKENGKAVPFTKNPNISETFAYDPKVVQPIHQWTKDLPVLGVGIGGKEGFFELNGQVHEYTYRPPVLVGVRNAYALYVQGGSVEPRYREGEMVWVNPNRPAKLGDYVVVQVAVGDGETPMATIGRLERRKPGVLVLGKHNPEHQIEIPEGQVVSVHVIVMGGAPL